MPTRRKGYCLPLLVLSGLLLWPAAAGAQGPGSTPPSVVAHPDMLERELAARVDADKICWRLGEPRTVDWVARQDPVYRREVFGRYLLESIEGGWLWLLDDGSRGGDLRPAPEERVKGLRLTHLEVHHGYGGAAGWAEETIDGPLTRGRLRFEWTVPPERLCMADGLSLSARVEVLEGEPGAEKILFVLPLTREQMRREGPDVKACSPSASTAVDSQLGILRDEGRCHRSLAHLQEGAVWSIWLSLPESFWIVYPYEPLERQK